MAVIYVKCIKNYFGSDFIVGRGYQAESRDLGPNAFYLNSRIYTLQGLNLAFTRISYTEYIQCKDYSPYATPKIEKLVQEANKRYPVGTKFICAYYGSINTLKSIDDYQGNYGWYSDNYIIAWTEENSSQGSYLYYNGKWADIVETSKTSNSSSELPPKWCIKITEDNYKVVGEFYNRQSGSSCYNKIFEHHNYLSSHHQSLGFSIIEGGRGSYFSLLSPTEEFPEITYEQFEKHVLKKSSMVKKSLIGRYVKALVDSPHCIDMRKGDYAVFIGESSVEVVSTGTSGWAMPPVPYWKQIFELMPEGFIPEDPKSEEVVPEYVECIVDYGKARVGQIFDTRNDAIAQKLFNLSWKKVLIEYKHLHRKFKPSSKKFHDAQFVAEKSEFVLPEKYCIIASNREERIALRDHFYPNSDFEPTSKYFSQWSLVKDGPGHNPTNCWDYPEITFEQFKKYVLDKPGSTSIEVLKYTTKVDPKDSTDFHFNSSKVFKEPALIQVKNNKKKQSKFLIFNK